MKKECNSVISEYIRENPVVPQTVWIYLIPRSEEAKQIHGSVLDCMT